MPDILVMMKLCEIFSISLNDLVSEKQKRIKTSFLRNKIIITILAVLLAWLVAVISFVILNLTLSDPSYTWLSFIYALPVTGIILIVFTAIWGNKWFVCGSISFLIWMVCLGVYLPLRFFAPSTNDALVFYIGIPFQVLCIFSKGYWPPHYFHVHSEISDGNNIPSSAHFFCAGLFPCQ